MIRIKKILLFLMIVTCMFSCSANGQETNAKSTAILLKDSVRNDVLDDSLMFKVLCDSIINIIENAKDISARLIVKKDSVLTYDNKSIHKLTQQQSSVLIFLASAPQNFEKNTVVYGLFEPNVVFHFKYKKAEIKILFDFGLGKWQIADANNNEIKRFDIGTPELLRFAKQLFSENEFFYNIKKCTL